MIANYITGIRFLLIPYIFQSMMHDYWIQAFCLFGIAAVSDFLDGFIARRFNNETMLGKILDPLADKLLVLSSLYALSYYHHIASLPFYFFIFLLIKDLLLIFGAGILFLMKGSIVSPSFTAKITTTVEMLLVLYVSLCRAFLFPASSIVINFSLAILVSLSLYILIDYMIKGVACLKEA